jgi:hypothetical protein
METAEQCDFGMPKPDCSVGIKPMTGDKEKYMTLVFYGTKRKEKKDLGNKKKKRVSVWPELASSFSSPFPWSVSDHSFPLGLNIENILLHFHKVARTSAGAIVNALNFEVGEVSPS